MLKASEQFQRKPFGLPQEIEGINCRYLEFQSDENGGKISRRNRGKKKNMGI